MTTNSEPAGQVVTPYICVPDARAAIDWYVTVLGARRSVEPIVMPDGTVGHAEIAFGQDAAVMLSDPYPQLGVDSPAPDRGAAVTLHLRVGDVDAVVAAAEASGVSIDRAPELTDHGRLAVLRDPFGHRWLLNGPAGNEGSQS